MNTHVVRTSCCAEMKPRWDLAVHRSGMMTCSASGPTTRMGSIVNTYGGIVTQAWPHVRTPQYHARLHNGVFVFARAFSVHDVR